MRIFLSIILLLLYSQSHSGVVDSLQNRLKQATKDNEKAILYIELAKKYISDDLIKTEESAKKALLLAEKHNYINEKGNALYLLGRVYELKELYDSASYYYTEGLNILKNTSDENKKARLFYRLGNVYKKKGFYSLSLKNCLQALSIYEEQNNTNGLAGVYNCLGSIYKYQGDYSQSLNYYNKSLKIRLDKNDQIGAALLYNNIGIVYVLIGEQEKALDFYNKSLDIKKEGEQNKNIAITLGNIGDIYLNQGKYDEAYECFIKGLQIHQECKYRRGIASQYQSIGSYYYKLEKLDSALSYYTKAYAISDEIGRLESIKDNTKALSEIYSRLGQHELALNYHMKFKAVSDSIFDVEKAKKMAQIEFNYQSEKEEELTRIANQKRNIIISSTFAMLLLIIIIVALLYNRQRSKIKRQELVHKNLKLEKQQIQLKLESKDKELATYALYLAKKNELMNTILEKLNKTKSNLKKENVSKIQEVINEINLNIDNDSWKEFEIRFLDVHKCFYDNLNKEYPELSSNERRLSAFLRLNLSTKEISAITNQSPHSINIARTRLRKKLNIANTDINLNVFLSKY